MSDAENEEEDIPDDVQLLADMLDASADWADADAPQMVVTLASDAGVHEGTINQAVEVSDEIIWKEVGVDGR